jgi:hypothetical protein
MFHPHLPHLCLASALTCVLTLACQDPPRPGTPSEPASASAGVGDLPFELDVVAVRDCEAPLYAALENEQMLLGVNVKLRALGDQVPQNYFYGSLVDSERQRYRASFAGCGPRLVGDPLRRGMTATGFINFRVPRDAHGLTLEYAPRIGNTEKARGNVRARDLGR